MADLTCKNCGKVFPFPSVLTRHLNRKRPCKLIVETEELPQADQAKPFPCKFCGRRFASQPSVCQHIRKNCKIANSEEGLDLLYEHTLRRQLAAEKARVDKLESQFKELQMQVASGACAPAACAGASVDMHDNNGKFYNQSLDASTNININIFGGEQHDHIDGKAVKAILDNVLRTTKDPGQAALQAMLRTAMVIYSDPSHPENLTCFLPNKKHDNVMVHVDKGGGASSWEVQPYTLVAPPMTKNTIDVLFDNQPFEDARKYGELMCALRDNETAYKEGKEMKTILVRNKDLLERALGSLPRAVTSPPRPLIPLE